MLYKNIKYLFHNTRAIFRTVEFKDLYLKSKNFNMISLFFDGVHFPTEYIIKIQNDLFKLIKDIRGFSKMHS